MTIWHQDRNRILFCILFGACVLSMLDWDTNSAVLTRSEENTTKNESTLLFFANDTLRPNTHSRPYNKFRKLKCPPCPINIKNKTIQNGTNSSLNFIKCSVNGIYTINCRKDNGEVFMPTSFIQKYFEVYGETKKIKGKELFQLNYSYGKVNAPTQVYEPGGAFLNFKFYHVEVRAMLKCVTASEGVPLAVQWNPAGYFYAIAVAQFGLSHHAKGIVDGNPEPTILSNGKRGPKGWKLPTGVKGCKVTVTTDRVKGIKTKVVAFTAPEPMTSKGPKMTLNSHDLALCVSIKMLSPGGLTVEVRIVDGRSGFVHFTHDDFYMEVEGLHVTLGMKQENLGKWMRLSRDLNIDFSKGIKQTNQVTKIVSVTLHGKGYIDNMTLAATAHNENLMNAADWLGTTPPPNVKLNNQDAKGGWPTSTAMRTAEIKLPPNWYSAMGQGQAMSALVRAFNLTRDRKYLVAAEKALHLFTLSSEEGGVRARFMGLLDWYEEYPTVPTSSFVLNGFIFSMMGLYDVMKTSKGKPQGLAQKLWGAGMKSLKFMLGMYDTGAGTLYDLRHVINHEPPNRARWDYHRTHIALIHEMAIVDGDPIFWETWRRWKGYLKGIRSNVNEDYEDIPI